MVVNKQTAEIVRENIKTSLVIDKAYVQSVSNANMSAANVRQRIVVLDMRIEEQMAFWQILHNRPESFEIISEKEIAQQKQYYIRVLFREKSDNELPEVKTLKDLLSEYLHGKPARLL